MSWASENRFVVLRNTGGGNQWEGCTLPPPVVYHISFHKRSQGAFVFTYVGPAVADCHAEGYHQADEEEEEASRGKEYLLYFYRQPLAAVNIPKKFLPLAASAYYKYFYKTRSTQHLH